MLHFTNKSMKSQALELQSYLPTQHLLLASGQVSKMFTALGVHREKYPQARKEKVPWEFRTCAQFSSEKQSLCRRQSLMQMWDLCASGVLFC